MNRSPLPSAEAGRALNSPILTPRLLLEPLVAAHAGAFFAPLQDEAIYRWVASPRPGSVEALAERWARNESRVSPDGSEIWLAWAVRRVSDGAYTGKVDATVNGVHSANNIGYIIFPSFWGQGYATEAVVAVVEHLIANGITRLAATVRVGNAASARVLVKAGFVFERVVPGDDAGHDTRYDDEEYVRLADFGAPQAQPDG